MKIVQRWFHYAQSRRLARLKRREQKILKDLIKHKTKREPRKGDSKQRIKTTDSKVKLEPEAPRRRKLQPTQSKLIQAGVKKPPLPDKNKLIDIIINNG